MFEIITLSVLASGVATISVCSYKWSKEKARLVQYHGECMEYLKTYLPMCDAEEKRMVQEAIDIHWGERFNYL